MTEKVVYKYLGIDLGSHDETVYGEYNLATGEYRQITKEEYNERIKATSHAVVSGNLPTGSTS
jgi:hypothetical protein